MDTHFIFEQVRKMRPSSFSEKERHRYLAEKMMLRQFLLMKHQDQLPDYLTVRHMKTWLLTRRSFLEEFQEINERTEIDHLFMAELAWTTARHFCLHQMEAELLEELDKEKRLSQLLGRIVTLEGLQMFVSLIHTAAEEEVQTFLQSLNKKLLKIFSGIEIKGGLVSAGDAKPAEISQLEQSTAPLVPKVVDTALKFLLEEPQQENKREAASAEIGKLLTNSAAPCLSLVGNMSKTLLLRLCTIDARYMVKAIYERFDKSSKSFHLMDYDESYHTAKEGTISAIQDMGYEVQSDAFSQAHLQLEDGLLEESEVSPEVTLDEEIDTTSNDVTEDNTEATLAQYSAVQNMDHEVQNNTSSQDHLQLKDGLLEERGASPGIYLNEDCDTLPNDVTKDKTEESLVQDSAIQDMDFEVQCDASSQARILLEEGLLEESGASPEVVSTEELEKELQNTDTLPNDVTENKTEESLVQDSAIQDMDFEVQCDASSQACIQLKDGLLEESGASPGVYLNEDCDTLPNDMTEDKTEESLVQDSAIQDMDFEVQCDASSQAHILLEEGLLEESGASPEVVSKEKMENGLTEIDTMENDMTDDKKEENLFQGPVVQNLHHDVQSDTSSQADLQLEEEGPIEEREASPLVSLEKAATTVSPPDGSEDTSSAKLETSVVGQLEKRESSPKEIQDTHALRLESNVIVYMDDELEELQEEEVTGVGSFFCGLWKMVTCCFCVSTEK